MCAMTRAHRTTNSSFWFFTGREDNEKSYLLSAKEILSTFREVVDGSRTLLRVGGAKLLADSNYEVTRKGLALVHQHANNGT